MPICTQCGTDNPKNAPRCSKCGVAFSHQVRARADAQRTTVASAAQLLVRIVCVILVIVAAPLIYRSAGTAYFRYRLNTVIESANKACGGPISSTTPSYQKDQIDHCLATDDVLIKAQTDFDNFTHTKHS